MRFAIAFSDRAWSSRARGVRHVTISVDFPSALAIVFGLCEADGTSPVVQFLIGVGKRIISRSHATVDVEAGAVSAMAVESTNDATVSLEQEQQQQQQPPRKRQRQVLVQQQQQQRQYHHHHQQVEALDNNTAQGVVRDELILLGPSSQQRESGFAARHNHNHRRNFYPSYAIGVTG